MSSVPKCFEYVVLDIYLGVDALMTLAGVYCPPSAPNTALEDLGKLLSLYVSSELVLLEDQNFDWLSDSSIKLKELCLELNLTQFIQFPTRPYTKNPF